MNNRPVSPVPEAGPHPHPHRGARRRSGFTLLEAQVAFVLLGIGLAGVCPLIVMQVKLSKTVAKGFGQNGMFQNGGRTYLVPFAAPPPLPAPESYMPPQPPLSRWWQKLGAAARLSTSPLPTALPAEPGKSKLSISGPVSRPFGSDSIFITVQRTPPPPPSESPP
jgi:type II secretory pathway pseudopilin PulG